MTTYVHHVEKTIGQAPCEEKDGGDDDRHDRLARVDNGDNRLSMLDVEALDCFDGLAEEGANSRSHSREDHGFRVKNLVKRRQGNFESRS